MCIRHILGRKQKAESRKGRQPHSLLHTAYSQHKGFTLIELLVVIAIIGVLSSVVLVSLNGARVRARDARRVSDLKQIVTALNLYIDATAAYPIASGASANASFEAMAQTLITVGFISAIPKDPRNGAFLSGTAGPKYEYLYATDTLGKGFHLGANLENVAEGAGVLASDSDCDSSVTTANACGSTAYTNGFNGKDAPGQAVFDIKG